MTNDSQVYISYGNGRYVRVGSLKSVDRGGPSISVHDVTRKGLNIVERVYAEGRLCRIKVDAGKVNGIPMSIKARCAIIGIGISETSLDLDLRLV